MKGKVVPLGLTKTRALQIVRDAAKDTSRVQWTLHAEARMRARRITTTQVLDVLRKGVIVEGPAPSIKGGWTCTIERFVAGDQLAVVVAIEKDQRGQPVIIVTAYTA